MTDSAQDRLLEVPLAADGLFLGVQRMSGRARHRIAIGALVVIGLLFMVRVGLTFLGMQVQSLLAGTVEFGTGGSGCSIEGKAAALTRTGTMHVVAHLRRDVNPGEVIRLTVTDDAGGAEGSETAAVAPTGCVSIVIPLEAVDPGRYAFDYRVGSESLANGEVLIGP